MLYQFEGFALNTDTYELTRNGEEISIEPQVFEVLTYLIQHHQRIVSKEELLQHIWPEKFITEAALSSRLMAARKALGDSGTEQRFIRTVHGRGFRFVAEPAVVGAEGTTTPVHEEAFEQEIRFCTTRDGVNIAYATSGSGPPLVKAANWLTHLGFDPGSPVWGHLWKDLSEDFTLVRYDGRGSGLSDRDLKHYSFDSWVDDLEAVVDALGLERFPIFGISQGGSIAVAYATRHPGRVSHLIMLGAYGRGGRKGPKERRERFDAMNPFFEHSWGKPDEVFSEFFSMSLVPDGTIEQRNWLTDLQRESASHENALKFHNVAGEVDVEALLPQLDIPTLVLHARGDQKVPFEEDRRLAGLIPYARLVALDSRNHLLLEHEPAFEKFRTEVRTFLAEDT